MPRYRITSPDGRKVTVSGDHEPTQAEAEGIFKSLPAKPTPDRFESSISQDPEAGSNSLALVPIQSNPFTEAAYSGIGVPSATTGEDAARNLAIGGGILATGGAAAVLAPAAAPVAIGAGKGAVANVGAGAAWDIGEGILRGSSPLDIAKDIINSSANRAMTGAALGAMLRGLPQGGVDKVIGYLPAKLKRLAEYVTGRNGIKQAAAAAPSTLKSGLVNQFSQPY